MRGEDGGVGVGFSFICKVSRFQGLFQSGTMGVEKKEIIGLRVRDALPQEGDARVHGRVEGPKTSGASDVGRGRIPRTTTPSVSVVWTTGRVCDSNVARTVVLTLLEIGNYTTVKKV